MNRILNIGLLALGLIILVSCDRDEDNFTVIQGNEYYSQESNIETLLREIDPQEKVLRFSYKNDQNHPYDQQLNLGAFKDRILFELTPLSFEDRFRELYRGRVEVSIEYINNSQDYLRRGFNTQSIDQSSLEFDFALRMIFTDDKGFRLGLRDSGLDISLISTGDFVSEDVYTLADPDNGWPYLWKDHPLEEELGINSIIMTEGGNSFIKYEFNMRDNQWMAFGRKSESDNLKDLCIEINAEDLAENTDNTMAFAIMNDPSNTRIIQFHYNEDMGTFCSDAYPQDEISRIVICSLDEYVDYFYHESFYQNTSSNNLVVNYDKIALETLIERLSSI